MKAVSVGADEESEQRKQMKYFIIDDERVEDPLRVLDHSFRSLSCASASYPSAERAEKNNGCKRGKR